MCRRAFRWRAELDRAYAAIARRTRTISSSLLRSDVASSRRAGERADQHVGSRVPISVMSMHELGLRGAHPSR